MARSTIGSLWDRGNRNELNRMLEELYSSVFLFNDGTGFITSKHLADDSVTNSKIQNGAVSRGKISDGAVTNTKLGTRSITWDKLDEGAVTGSRIADGAVGNAKIGNGAVTSEKLDDGAVTTNKIQGYAVTNSRIAAGAIDDRTLADNAVARKNILNNAVGTLQIADDTISKEKIKANSVDHTKLGVDSIMMNKGKDYPLKSVKLGDTAPANIATIVKNAVLDAKIYGAKLNMYYRLSFIANGYTSLGSSRYGISLEEVRANTGVVEKIIFSYNQEDREGNYQNATIRRGGDVDTIIVENGKYVASITVDRTVISASSSPEFINLSSGVGSSPTAIIDPVNYSYSNVIEDALTINRGKDYPLKVVNLIDSSATTIAILTKNAVLDAKVFGAEIGKYYRLSTIGNGRESNGKARYGITVEQRNVSDGAFEKFVFVYNDDNRLGNEQNANIQKLSDSIDTITVDNGEIAVSVTVDRMVITNSTTPDLLNLSSGPGVSNSAVIDPSNYSF